MKEIHLTDPSESALEDAYRKLSKGGFSSIVIKNRKLEEVLVELERAGFVGMEILNFGIDYLPQNIKAYKGKHGPCHNAGRKARYTGSALAVLDDDNHLLMAGKESAVCEKTAYVYRFPPYNDLIEVSGDSKQLLDRLRSDPEPFTLDDLDMDLFNLFSLLKKRDKQLDRVPLFYPGPFRTLVLSDGSLVRRGTINSVPESEATKLIHSDRFELCESVMNPKPVYFQDRYEDEGSAFLLERSQMHKIKEEKPELDLNALADLRAPLRDRILQMIRTETKYFILTGSDPGDVHGCCPSVEVGEANRLVHAGILQAVADEPTDDSCPVTIYAFGDEIEISGTELKFSRNEKLRARVWRILNKRKQFDPKTVLKWALLIFVILSLSLATLRIKDQFTDNNINRSLHDQLTNASDSSVVVILFHNHPRCAMCLNMESHVRELLNQKYSESFKKDNVQLVLINMNDQANRDLVERFNIYTASLVLVRMEGGEEKDFRILDDVWKTHEDEKAFKQKVEQSLQELLNLQ